ncbi:exosortase/archaeosortase family protein [Microbacterium sp. B24]|uniref:exosortase/archaeosortase family protein n=1 Tax=Microbacterium sp. B24 TaxID=95616 RepID=UPI0011D1980F|nr:exosortase/archaeosortase family protein [Microbacterium sp. B24]
MTQSLTTTRFSYRPISSISRWVVAIGLVCSIVAGVALLTNVLAFEASIAARVLDSVFMVPASAPSGQAYIRYVADYPYVLVVTPECSAVFLTAPFIAASALLVLSDRFTVKRIMATLSISIGVILAINALRIAFIAAALAWWGMDGYGWSHTVVGSALSFIAIGVSTAIFYVALTRPGAPRRPRRSLQPE